MRRLDHTQIQKLAQGQYEIYSVPEGTGTGVPLFFCCSKCGSVSVAWCHGFTEIEREIFRRTSGLGNSQCCQSEVVDEEMQVQ